MDSEPSLARATLRHVAVVLGGTLGFLGLLCGVMLVVSLATSKKEGASSPTTTSAAEPSPSSAASPDVAKGAPKAKKPSI